MRRVSMRIFLALAMLAPGAYAQNITGSMSGRIVDQQGASVPNATVTVTEPAKKLTVAAKTNDTGDFYVAGLLPGNYTLEVEAAGFKKLSRPGIELNAQDKLALGNLPLEVGAVSESVEVSAQAALLQTESVERSQAIVGKQIENIEVNGRNPIDMAKLVPGVVSTANVAAGGVGGLSGLQINGNRGTENQLTINGISDIDTGANGSQNVTISQDSIAEFKILTGTYQAEYGRNAGGQISIVSKSGTDQFHGSGYFYHRHEDMNANTFINNVRGLPRPLFRYNDPGYTIGGPVIIPKLFNGRNKLFFFWSQEWQNQLTANSVRNVMVPTAAERNGDFSQTLDKNGKPLASLKDPLGGVFPGLVVPQSRITPVGQAILNFFPLPNTSQTGYNYSSQKSGTTPRREDLLRLDYNLTSNLRVFGHWIQNKTQILNPYGSFVLGPNLPITSILDNRPGKSLAAGATWVLSPTMTNEFNWGYTRNTIDITEIGDKLRRKTTGINLPLLYTSALQDDYIPNLRFNGTNFGSNDPNLVSNDAPFHNYNTTIDISNNLTKVWGSHTVKAGIFLQRSRKDQTSFNDNNGSYNFGDNPSNPYDTGWSYANALLGVYNTMDQASSYINGMYRYWNIEEFIQDTWKVTPRLTFDYGLRGQWYQPQYDSSLQASTFVLNDWDAKKAPRLYLPGLVNGSRVAYDSVTGQTLPAYAVGLEIPGSGDPFNGICQAAKCIGKYLQRNRGEQWGPRFGIAWDVTGQQNIVIRTGGGIYYDRFQGNRVFDFVRNPPESVQPTLNQGFVADINPSQILLGPPNLFMADPIAKIPTVYNYQFSVQTRLPWSMMLDTAYVGSLSRHLQDNRNLNYIPFGATFQPQNQDPTRVATSPTALFGNNALDRNFLRPIYGYGDISLYESQATGNYNSLQVQLQRRAANGLFFGIAYTYSKALTTAQSDTSFVRPDQFERLANYGPASFDRRHTFVANYVYTTPQFKFGNAFTHIFTNGWQISGVTQIISGYPFTPAVSIASANNQNITGSYTEGTRIGMVNGCNPYTGSGDPFNYLNASCFFAPSPGSIGLESGNNQLYGPGVVDFDMSLQKEFAVKERLRFQFRVDAFNVFNHPTFYNTPNNTLNFNAYPTSGGVVTGLPSITSTALGRNANGNFNVTGFGTEQVPNPGFVGYARILQLVVRVQF